MLVGPIHPITNCVFLSSCLQKIDCNQQTLQRKLLYILYLPGCNFVVALTAGLEAMRCLLLFVRSCFVFNSPKMIFPRPTTLNTLYTLLRALEHALKCVPAQPEAQNHSLFSSRETKNTRPSESPPLPPPHLATHPTIGRKPFFFFSSFLQTEFSGPIV